MSRIIRLEAENIKNLKAIALEPDPTLQIIAGANGQGKTAIADAVLFALDPQALKSNQGRSPLRLGTKKGKVKLTLENYVVERTIDDHDKMTIKIWDKRKVPQGTPQTILDSIRTRFFDPEEFLDLDEARQNKVFLDLAGIDPTPFEKEKARLMEARKEKKKELANEEAVYKTLPFPAPGLPDSYVEVAEVSETIRVLNKQLAKHSSEISRKEQARYRVESIRADIERLTKELQVKQTQYDEALAAFNDPIWQEHIDSAKRITAEVAALQTGLMDVATLNEQIRHKLAYQESQAKQTVLVREIEVLTGQIDDVDAERLDALAAARLPLPGLSYDEGLRYNQVPLAQCSDSERFEVSMAIGLALSKELRVFWFKRGSLLDEKRINSIHQWAAAHDAQIFLEVVASDSSVGIVISEGEIVSR